MIRISTECDDLRLIIKHLSTKLYFYGFKPQRRTLTDGWPEGLGEPGLESDVVEPSCPTLIFCSLTSVVLLDVVECCIDSFSCACEARYCSLSEETVNELFDFSLSTLLP